MNNIKVSFAIRFIDEIYVTVGMGIIVYYYIIVIRKEHNIKVFKQN